MKTLPLQNLAFCGKFYEMGSWIKGRIWESEILQYENEISLK